MEDGLSMLDTSNNEAELGIALEHIDVSVKEGWSYERAVQKWGIRGHPYFAEFFPVKKYWGDARIARQALGLPLE